MTTGNGSTAIGVLADIIGRLESIKPAQFIAPDTEREKSAHIVATAGDDIKRLFTLRYTLTDQCGELIARGQKMSKAVLKDVLQRGPHEIHKKLRARGSSALETKEATLQIDSDLRRLRDLREIDSDLRRLRDLREIVNDIFWLEVKRQHPGLADKPTIGIYSDWSLCWQERTAGDREFGIRGVNNRGLIGLTELFGRRMG